MKKLLAITIALVMLLAAMPVFAAETTTEVPDSKFTGNIVLQDEYYDYYAKLLKDNEGKLMEVVQFLLDNESMTGAQFADCMEGKQINTDTNVSLFDSFKEEE